MKKILLFCGILVAAVTSSYGQGTVTFANNASALVTENGAPAPVGYNVALYWSATNPGDDLGALTPIATANIAPVPGRFSGGVVTTPTATPGGGTAWFQVRAWQNGVPTWNDAANRGNSPIWSQVTGNATPTDLPKSIIPPTGGLTSFAVVPEPSSIALGVLGLGAIALFRRRK